MLITSHRGAGVSERRSAGLLRGTPPLHVAALLLLCSFVIHHSAFAEAPVSGDFFEQHCYDCHDAEAKKGGLDLTALAFQPDDAGNFARWVKVLDRLSAGEMPPKKRARPAAADLEGFTSEVA